MGVNVGSSPTLPTHKAFNETLWVDVSVLVIEIY